MSARVRIRVEQGLAILTGFLGLLTIFWRDWIEGLTGFDPDHHSGSAEVGIIVGLLAVSIVLFLVSRVEIRRASSAAPIA
jgi:hypothetical protein